VDIPGVVVMPDSSSISRQVCHASRPSAALHCWTSQQWHPRASPRASIALFRCAQALAAVSGRNYVLPDDVKKIAPPVLTHRVIVRPESRLRKMTAAAIVEDLIEDVPVPMLSNVLT